MSYHVSRWARRQDVAAGATRRILDELADHASDAGECWPCEQRLARRARCSTRHVRRCLRELEAEGLLNTTARARRNGSQASNRYRLACPVRPPLPPARACRASSSPLRAQLCPPPNPQQPSRASSVVVSGSLKSKRERQRRRSRKRARPASPAIPTNRKAPDFGGALIPSSARGPKRTSSPRPLDVLAALGLDDRAALQDADAAAGPPARRRRWHSPPPQPHHGRHAPANGPNGAANNPSEPPGSLPQ